MPYFLHRERFPSHADLRSLCDPPVIPLVSFGGSEEDPSDGSMSLAASDTEDWSGSVISLEIRAVARSVVLERHIWLNLMEIKVADKAAFLNSPVSPNGLFDPAVDGFTERFTASCPSSSSSSAVLRVTRNA